MIVSSALRKDGVVYIGKRHNEIFKQKPFGILRDAEQGFMTDKFEFLNRLEACKHAIECGQIKKQNYYYGLDSSDLW
jgi:hypothetical protein